MPDIKKTEIYFLKVNSDKLNTITNFLDLPLDDVVNASFYLGLYKIWLPIAKLMDEFPDWDLSPGEETEKLYSLKQQSIEDIHSTNKNFPKIEVMEKNFNKINSNKPFKSNSERYKAFIDYVESQLEEKKPQPSKPGKEIVIKEVPPNVVEIPQTEDFLKPDKKSTIKIALLFLIKTSIFIFFFTTPILLLVVISVVLFKWNYLAILKYQPELLFLLVFVMILLGIVFGWVSTILTRQYQSRVNERKLKKGVAKA